MRKLLFSNNKIILKKNNLILRNHIRHKVSNESKVSNENNSLPKQGGQIKPYRLMGTVQAPSMGYGSGIIPSSLSSDLSRLNFSNKSKNKNVRLMQPGY